ncbi:MAG: NAD(P)-dependent oxidoreductase [Synechococcus sp. cluster2_bin.235]|nr:NAD(P)-dependent oxidoreductase [Synechococcus sp. cluster2_bin.235]
MNSPTAVAMVGLGALGLPMAINLRRAGYRLNVHTRSRLAESSAELVDDQGPRVISSSSPNEAVHGCAVLVICVSDDAAVEAVLWGDGGAGYALTPGSLVIDCSTIAPATAAAMAKRLAEQNVHYIDAPVTGGTEGAKAGTLTVLCGGETKALEQARPLLEVIGGSIHHFGPVGSGQQVKAVNQVLVAGSYAAVAEAITLGQHLQLPMERVVAALIGGAAGSWALQHRSAAMLADQYPLGFKLALHHKDLKIALAAAKEQQLELPLTQLVLEQESELMQQGLGNADVSALRRCYPANPNQG